MTPRWLPRAPDGYYYALDRDGRWWVGTPDGQARLREHVRESWKRRTGAFPPEQVLTGRSAA